MLYNLHRTCVRGLAGLFAGAILLAPLAARCSIPSAVLQQGGSPIRIDRCVGDVADSDVGNRRYYFEAAAAFTNTSPHAVNAVRFHFDVFNAFREHLRTYYGTYSDAIEAGASESDIKPSAQLAQEAAQAAAIGAPPASSELVNALFDPAW